jgi:hypothetical protein
MTKERTAPLERSFPIQAHLFGLLGLPFAGPEKRDYGSHPKAYPDPYEHC